MNAKPMTLRRDAREVCAGEFVVVDQLPRRVVRARQVVLADTPAAVVHGAQVAVVVGI